MSDVATAGSPHANAQRVPLTRREGAVVLLVVLAVLAAISILATVFQDSAQDGAVTSGGAPPAGLKERREVDKLTAEVKRIRSDTQGSLFWLKLTGVFVTVGAAVGGYLVAQSRSVRVRAEADERQAQERLDFDRRAQVDAAYQAIVQELSASDSSLRRATAAMKLGKILTAPPVEWHLGPERRAELWSLTKQILATALAIEEEEKVRKALTISVSLHSSIHERSSLRGLDFSLANAADAYWARIDFTGADFYRADLTSASFRGATLVNAQFREAKLVGGVLADADCTGANFKFADLRRADLSGANLTGCTLDKTRVHGLKLGDGALSFNLEGCVDIAEDDDNSELLTVRDWLASA